MTLRLPLNNDCFVIAKARVKPTNKLKVVTVFIN